MITNLKIKILEKNITQSTIARRTGINEGTVSLITNGRLVPTENQRLLISVLLNAEPEDLFEPYQLESD
ncbi:helix-turn-helix transcriptional regulator [bacterium]|nr:helix-turn-helix transcriptional regulator [bacterium]